MVVNPILRFFDILGRLVDFKNRPKPLFSLNTVHASTQFNNYYHDRQKLAMVLSNPAALKVFSIQCDLFSMGEIKVKDQDGNEIEDDPFLKLIGRPNPFQTQAQFLWDFMFWLMLGNDYTYCHSRVVDRPDNKLYHLEPGKIEWPRALQADADKLIFSDAEIKQRGKMSLVYRYHDHTSESLLLDRIITSNDLTNGTGNWYKGSSRIDALYKVISNSEAALDSKNINVRYAGKFLVGSQNQVDKMMLGQEEKDDIINKMETNDKNVFPLGNLVKIQRFVDDLKSMELDNTYQGDYYIIGGLYGIPRDVLEAYLKSSTYENQEKARAAHVAYTLSPKGEQWMDSYERHFGYTDQGKNITISWDHLPMMKAFKKEEAETNKVQIETFTDMLAAGIPIDEANEFLGTEFTIDETKKTPPPNGNTNQTQSGANQGNQGTATGQNQAATYPGNGQ